MRTTAPLLLTAALLIPGAAQAQPGIPGSYEPFGRRPGIRAGEPYVPDGLIGGSPFGQPARTQFPPGAADPYNPTARMQDPNWWNTIHEQAIPAVPQAPLIDAKALESYKQDLTPQPMPSPSGGCNWVGIIVVGALWVLATGAAAGGRRSSGERK